MQGVLRYEPNCMELYDVVAKKPTLERWEKIKADLLESFDAKNLDLYLQGSFLTFLKDGLHEDKRLHPKDIDILLLGPRPTDYSEMERTMENIIKIGWKHDTQIDTMYTPSQPFMKDGVLITGSSVITYAYRVLWNGKIKKDLGLASPIKRGNKLFEFPTCVSVLGKQKYKVKQLGFKYYPQEKITNT